MNGDKDRIIAEAATWHIASAHDDMDWDGFTAWLEADPRHRVAYDEVALADAMLDEHRDTLLDGHRAANDDQPSEQPAAPRAGWRRWAGMAIAASLLAVLLVPQFLQPSPVIYQTETVDRRIALVDGSSILLAPHSRLVVEGRKQERMTLAGGAWFDIRHNPSRPLAITASGVVISDIGTQFDVQANDGQVRVEVGQGEVHVRSSAFDRPLRLTQGRGLLYDANNGTAVIHSVNSDSIGEWRSGRLSFDGVPLVLVAADLSRYADVRVTVAPGLRNRQFSGTLVIGDGEAALRDLSQLMDVQLRRSPAGYMLDDRR